MKPKEYLFKHGHITTIGRGRMSREHIAIIEEAVKNGEKIEGYSSTPAPDSAEKTVAKTEKPEFTGIAAVGDPRRDERTLSAYTFHNGVKRAVGMRTVCNICRSSLTYCACPHPKIWVEFDTESVVLFGDNTTKGV